MKVAFVQSYSHSEGGAATRSPELFDSLESPMLKEKDLRGFKKRAKSRRKAETPRASRFALLLPTFGRAVPALGSESFHAWCGSCGPSIVIPAYFKICAMGTPRRFLR